MMSMPAASMSRMAVWAASSNISPRSVGPNSSRSSAFTDANHQPGLPCEPTTELGRIGSSAMGSAPPDVGVGGSYDSLRHKSVEMEGGAQKTRLAPGRDRRRALQSRGGTNAGSRPAVTQTGD